MARIIGRNTKIIFGDTLRVEFVPAIIVYVTNGRIHARLNEGNPLISDFADQIDAWAYAIKYQPPR